MKLRSMHKKDVACVARWMAMEENYQWLDFGAGKQLLEEPAIGMMNGRESHDFQLFTADQEENEPIGLVALSDISPSFNTATLWYVLGEKEHSGRNYTTRAVNKMLTRAFDRFNLQTVFAWAVERNMPSVRVLEKNNFCLIGRRRKCHYIKNRYCNRLLFDLLITEHKEFNHEYR